MHGLIIESSISLLAGSTRFVPLFQGTVKLQMEPDKEISVRRSLTPPACLWDSACALLRPRYLSALDWAKRTALHQHTQEPLAPSHTFMRTHFHVGTDSGPFQRWNPELCLHVVPHSRIHRCQPSPAILHLMWDGTWNDNLRQFPFFRNRKKHKASTETLLWDKYQVVSAALQHVNNTNTFLILIYIDFCTLNRQPKWFTSLSASGSGWLVSST